MKIKSLARRHRNAVRRSQRWVNLAIVLAMVISLFPWNISLPGPLPDLGPDVASAHNLDARAVYVYFDADTQAYLDGLIATNQRPAGTPLLQPGDELGIIIKAIPMDGTTTGVGGYTTFYVPNGVQVVDAAYLMPGDLIADGITGFDKVPMKGQAQMPIVGAGGDSTVSLVGNGPPDIGYGPKTNILGQSSNYVNASNGNLGTVVGVYGDTGIFYSTVPETAFGSYWDGASTSPGDITNNSGDTVGWRTVLGTTLNMWDAWQMAAYGINGTTNPNYPSAAIIDSNQRGYAPWGLANVVAGPQSGYAWEFDGNAYAGGNLKAAVTTGNFTAAIDVGPWQRIKYPGSQISDDPPGGSPNPPYPQPYTRGTDASNVGFDLVAGDLPQTTGQDNGTPNAVRWAYGQQVQFRPEYMWIKIKVFDNTAILDPTGCPKWTVDTFGGDAGGDSGGKDHIWRYYDPNSVTLNGCLAIGKPATKELVKVGDNFQYKVKLYNAGAKDYSTVQIQDTLPSGVTYISAVPAPSNVSLPNLTWTVSPFLRSQMFEATVTVQAKSSGPIENKVCASGTPALGGPNENSCGTDITVVGNQPLLRQGKSVNPTAVAPGGTVQYTVDVLNVGSGPSGSPVVITEYLPAGFTYTGAIPGTVVATINGANISASVSGTTAQPVFTVPAAINAGKSLLIPFNALVGNAVMAGPYCNSYRASEGGINQITGALACVQVGGGAIGDTVYRDWNGNNTQDAGEEGIPGIQVCANPGNHCSTTDATGKYLINGLTADTYSVDVTNPPAGYTATQGAHPTSVTLAQNDERLDVDYGYQPGGTGGIGDQVYEDKGNDGQYNPLSGDVGIPGVEVCLFADTNGNGTADVPVTGAGTQGASNHCVVTNASGIYGFTGLAEGLNYVVQVNETNGTLATYFNPDPFQNTTGNPLVITNLTGTNNTADFGYFRVLPSSIGDEVFVDTNGNGVFDPGVDAPMPSITVELYRNGVLFKTDVTDVNGNYLFDNLGPGDYTVAVLSTDPDVPSGFAPTKLSYDLTLVPSTNILTADFPFVQRLQKSVDKTKIVTAPDTLTYTIVVNYPGSELLSNVIVTDTTPPGTTYLGNASPTPLTQPLIGATGVISWNLGSNTAGKDGTVVPAVTLNPSKDTFVDQESGGNDNYGADPTFAVEAENSKYKHGLLQFDLSPVCPGVVQNAQLVLEKSSGDDNAQNVSVYRLTRSWVEGDSTVGSGATWLTYDGTNAWTTSGGDFAATVYATTSVSAENTYTWDVTTLVNQWCLGTQTNFGLLLKATTEPGTNDKYIFDSRTGATQPKLKINGGGPEFNAPTQVTNQLGSNDSLNPALAFDSADVAHSVFEGKVGATDSRVNIYYSNRQTGSWSAPVKISIEPPFDIQDALNPRIAIDSSGNLHVVFQTKLASGQVNAFYVKGTKSGTAPTAIYAWGNVANISNNLGGNDSLMPDIAVDSTGFAHVVFEGKGGSDSKLNIYYSNDGGTGTWTTPVKLTASPPFDEQDALNPRIVRDSSDNLHIVFQSKLASGQVNVFYIKATKSGGGWTYGSAQNVSNNLGNQPSTVPDVAVDSAGKAHVVFRGKSAANGDNRFNIYYATNKNGIWSTPKKVSLEPPFDVQDALRAGITIAADGVLHVAFTNKTATDSKVNVYHTTISNGAIGSFTNISKDLGNQDSLSPDIAASSTVVRVVFQGKTGGKIDIFTSFFSLAASAGNLTNNLAASPTLVGGGASITVIQTLTSDTAQNNITPGTINVVGANGANAVCGSPTLTSANDDLDGTAGDAVTYNWTCTSSLGAGFGSVTFDATAAGDTIAFAKATSNSVLVVPPLTFKVTATGAVDPVVNTAYLRSDAIIPLTAARAETAILDSIGDFVWADLDGDGVQDVGEPGLSGVQVCATPVGGGAATCATTDGSGKYRIFGLSNGVDYVTTITPATLPANFLPTTPSSLTVTAAQRAAAPVPGFYSDADFGLRPPGGASIGDTVWIDANEDGVVDGTETLLPNITVKLYDSAGTNLLATTTTDANGVYTFTGLYAGNYKVQVDETSSVSSPYDGTTTLAAAMELVSGLAGNIINPTNPSPTVNVPTDSSAVTNVDFGFNWTGSIGDYVWFDDNLDGVPNEPASNKIPDAAVLLYFDADNNGKIEGPEWSPIAFMNTDSNGNYLFDNMPPGNYLVDVYEDSITTNGVRDIVPTTPNLRDVDLGPGQDVLTADFGYYEGALVEGNVFWDENRNGVLDASEQTSPYLLNDVKVDIVCFGPDGVPGGPDDYSGSMDTGTLGQSDGHFRFLVPPGPCTVTYDTGDSDIPGTLGDETTPTTYSFVAVAGEDWHPSFDFGLDNTGSVGDLVWNDANANGVLDVGEPGLAGITVKLYDSGGTILLATTATGPNGSYLFEGLADGNYIVKVDLATLPINSQQTGDPDVSSPPACAGGACDNQGTATVSGGGSDLALDFGYKLNSGGASSITLSGVVWDDNGAGAGTAENGVQDGTEPGIPGMTVDVVCDTGTFQTVTNGTGGWIVSGIDNGSDCVVTVDESTLPSMAYYQTGDPDESSPPKCSVCDAATSLTNITVDVPGIDFGYAQDLGSITGKVCASATGTLDLGPCDDGSDTPLVGVTVTLTYAGPDGLLGTGDDVTTKTTTNGSGIYTFPNLNPGLYGIVETNPIGYTSLGDRDGGNPDVINRMSIPSLTLRRGEDAINRDFEDFGAPTSAAIGDLVWYDANHDGIQDVGEPGIANVTVRLYLSDGDAFFEPGGDDVLVDETTTDADGGYLFHDAEPGDYWVDVVTGVGTPLAGLTFKTGPQSTGDPHGVLTVADGDTYRAADFGFYKEPAAGKAIVGDRVWVDVNGDGKQDPGEPGLPGVTVDILDSSNNTIGSAITDENGIYRIEVPAGNGYKAVPVTPVGFTPTTTQPRPLPNLAAGAQYLDADFGYNKAGLKTIAGLVFEDVGDNGVYNSGTDNIIAGVSVNLIRDTNNNGLLDAGEPIIATVVTNGGADGNGNNYSFGGLTAGKYLVRVSDTQNVLNSFELGNLGTPGLDDNSQGQPYAVDLTTAPESLSADFGYNRGTAIGGGDPTGIIGNQIWHDIDGDGLYEPGNGETGISGVTVELKLGASVVATTTTGASGNYVFTDLAAGTYSVTVSDDFNVLAGYLTTLHPTPGADNSNQVDPYTVVLPAGGFNFTADFGYALPVTIGDFIFFDPNGNGVQDPGETLGVDNVPITLTNVSTGQVFNTFSNLGNYSFSNLIPGTYAVSVPFTLLGISRTTLSPMQNTVLSGQSWLTADFGYVNPTAVNIVNFTAAADAEGVRLRWQTSLEEDLDGFVVLRADAADGEYSAVSDLIAAMNDPFGTSYEWLDESANADSLVWYKLQAQPDGEVFGPIPSREDPGVGGNNRVYIPMIVR